MSLKVNQINLGPERLNMRKLEREGKSSEFESNKLRYPNFCSHEKKNILLSLSKFFLQIL